MRVQFMLVAFAVTVVSGAAFGAEIPVQGRIFVGGTAVQPTELNNELTAQGLKKLETLPQFGAEITFPVLRFLNVGLRYAHRVGNSDEAPSNLTTEYLATLNQDSVFALVRIPILKSDFLRLDAFGGAGGSNTSFKIKTAAQDGELTRREGNDWFATPCFSYGGSIAVGYKWIFLALEAGVEQNEVSGFKRDGNINNNVQKVDLSGNYILLSLLFDGVPGKFK